MYTPLTPAEAPPPHIPAKPRRRWGRWLLLAIALLLLVALFVPFAYFWLTRDRLAQAIAEAERLDPGQVLYADLVKQWPAVPDADNGALTVLAVVKAMPQGLSRTVTIPESVPEELYLGPVASWGEIQSKCAPNYLLPAPLVPLLKAELAGLAEPLRLAEPLARQQAGRLPVTVDANVPSLNQVSDSLTSYRLATQLLQMQFLATLEAGPPEATVRSLLGLLGTARAVDRRGGLLAALTRAHLAGHVAAAVERWLAVTERPDQELMEVQAALAQERKVSLFLNSMRMERAFQIDQWQAAMTDPEKLRNLGGGGRFEQLFTRGSMQATAAVAVEELTKLVEAAKLPSRQRDAQFAELEAAVQERAKHGTWLGSPYVMVALLLPAYSKYSVAETRSHARLACAEAALAAERFRRQHQRWPTSLAELKPFHPGELPSDPFTDQPLQLKPWAEGLIIYSAGPDGRDDGGRITGDPAVPGLTPDLGLRLWDVPHRRKAYPVRSTEDKK